MNLLLLVNSSKAEEMLCPKIMLCEMLLSDKSLVNVFFVSFRESLLPFCIQIQKLFALKQKKKNPIISTVRENYVMTENNSVTNSEMN